MSQDVPVVDLQLLSLELEQLSHVLSSIGNSKAIIGEDVISCFEILSRVVRCLNLGRPNAPIGTGYFCSCVFHSVSPLVQILPSREAVSGAKAFLVELSGLLAADSVHARFLAQEEPASLAHATKLDQRRAEALFTTSAAIGYAKLLADFKHAHAIHGLRLFGIELMTDAELHRRRLEQPDELLPGHRNVYCVAETESGDDLMAVPIILGPGIDNHGRDIRQMMHLGASVAASEFTSLAREAGAHLPKRIRDALGLNAQDSENLWLEFLLRWRVAHHAASPPEFRQLLSSHPFRDSADLIEVVGLATESPIWPKSLLAPTVAPGRPRKRGRRPGANSNEDQRIFDAWQSGQHATYAALARARGKGEQVADIRRTVDRVRQQLKRAAATDQPSDK